MDDNFSETLISYYRQEGYTVDIEKSEDGILLHVTSPELQAIGIDAVAHYWSTYINDKGCLVYVMDMGDISFRIVTDSKPESEGLHSRLKEIFKMAVNALKVTQRSET